MIRLRTAAPAVLALSLSLVGLPAAAPAPAAEPPRAAQSQRSLTPAEQQVDSFFSQYRGDILRGDLQGARAVRQRYLTAHLNAVLDAWARAHDADPVFRAPNVPTDWSLTQGDSGAGHTRVNLTERWGDGSPTEVVYELRLATLVIDDLQDAPA
ncbi:hypothetical protein [Streptomyces rubellomurinus]|uniref:hypothetical protein n=1 Tax=Streptomyces rubellomurinus (strain ATCC 31215) TaxID=359131 RepID=UPI0006991A44|nr:hypothetical protein [Streptomyces rubellomurinus]